MQKNPPHVLVCHYASVAQLCQAMATFHDPWVIVPMGTQHIWQKIYAQHQSQAAGFIPRMCSFDQLVPHPHAKAKQQQFWQTYAFTQNYFATENIPPHAMHAKACQLQQIFLNDMALPLYLYLENIAAIQNSTVKNFIFHDSQQHIDDFLHGHMAIDDATRLARIELEADKHYFAAYIQHLLKHAARNKEANLLYPWSFYQAVQTWARQQNQVLLYIECGGLDLSVVQAGALMAQHYSGTQYRYQRVYHSNWVALYPDLQDANVDAILDAKAKTNLSLIEAPSIEKALHATFLCLREIIATRMPIDHNQHNIRADKKIDIYICIPHALLKTRFEQWAQTYGMAVHTSTPLGDTPLGLAIQACMHFVAQRWQHGKNQNLQHLDVIIKDILPLLNIPCFAKHVTQSLRNALRHYKSSTWRDFDQTLETLAASKTSANLQGDGKTADSPLQLQENWQKVQEIMHAFIDDLLSIPNMQNTSTWHHTLWKMFEYLDQSQDISHASFCGKFGAWFAGMDVDAEDIDRPLSVTEYAAIFRQWAKQTKVCIPPPQDKQIHLYCLSIQEAAMGAENERDDLIFLSCEQRAFNIQNAFDVQQMHQAMTQQWVNILLHYQHVHVITYTDSQQPQERARIVQAYISHHNIAPQMYDNMAKAKVVAEQIIALPNQGLLKQAIENISASQAVLLYQCPYAYYLKHVEKIPNPSPAPDFAVALEYGQAIHLFLDDFYRHTTPDARTYYETWHHHAQKHWSDYTKNWPDMHVKQLWQEFLTQAPKWHAWHNAHEATAYRYQTGECSYQAILHSGERTLKLEGRFDRIDHMQGAPEHLIIDYKYSQAFSKDTWAEKSLQLSIYRYLYQHQITDVAQKSKRHGIDIQIHAKFIFLKAEVDEMSSQEVDENIYLEHMDFLASIPHMTHLKAKPSKVCKYCDYRKICPMNASEEDGDEMD